MNMKELIEKIRGTDDCVVLPSSGQPKVENPEHCLPPDIKEFYSLCGGMTLFASKEYAVKIVEPSGFVLANPVIIGELCPEDISSQWYIVASDMNGDYITVDLSAERLGKCYDSFWDRHGIVGDCPIVAGSFSDLLSCFFNGNGDYWYWIQEDFISLGDAYD